MFRGLHLAILAVLSLFIVAQIVPTRPSLDYTCDADRPCFIGCCGGSGYCGFGPIFCGAGNCTSDCDRKSECDPGWGSAWSNATDCPLNVCCSEYGFCGTTKDFCGDLVVPEPECAPNGNSARQRVVGYYEAWSQQRNCDQQFPPELPLGAWTHINFAFVFINPDTFVLEPMDERDVPLYSQFTALKVNNTDLKTWVSVGGWSMNDPGPYATTFSDLAASKEAQQAFATSLINFMDEYGFDGVDIDWEYPVAEERSGRPEDFENFVTWMKSLKEVLGDRYGLSMTVPSSYWYMRHFDIVNLIKTVDFFNLMSYDLHGTWDAPNPYVGPYINSHTNLTEVDLAFDLLWRNDIPPEKVSLGLGFYGRSFTLEDASCNTAGCVWTDGGLAGTCTGNVGTLSFAEIEAEVARGATVSLDEPAAVQEVTFPPAQWVSYDDTETFRRKYEYANSRCLGGLLVWAVSLDDRNGSAQRQLCESLGCQVRVSDVNVGEHSCGSSRNCTQWHTVIPGDTCYSLYTGARLTFPGLRALNPQLDASCSNLRLGEAYCVAGVPTGNSTASCTAPASTPGSAIPSGGAGHGGGSTPNFESYPQTPTAPPAVGGGGGVSVSGGGGVSGTPTPEPSLEPGCSVLTRVYTLGPKEDL